MALSQRLELRQGQSLVMTPQLQQAIKLLQYSNIELSAYVEQELEKNPLLERDERDQDAGAQASETQDSDNTSTEKSDELREADVQISDEAPATNAENVLDTEYENVFSEDSAADAAENTQQDPYLSSEWSNVGSSSGSKPVDGDGPSFESRLAEDKDLREHLTDQLQVSISDPMERLIGSHLIDTVDENGYVRESIESIAERLGCAEALVETVLQKMQAFEPAGIMARSLQECLRLQLIEKDRLDPVMSTFLDHLDLLGSHRLDELKQICGIDDEDLAEIVADIRTCHPKPGLVFGSDLVQPVVPDVFVRETSEGVWKVELNTETLPRVLVNSQYYSEVNQNVDGEAKTYLAECLNDANWLVKSLDQRARTILKVSTEIVRQQDAFLVNGVEHLRPLNLKAIADAISMHESTVSRVTANKYMATSRGVFELKYFFTSAIAATSGGEAHSAEAVRHKIKTLIDDEAPNKILSDDRIVEMLKGAGIDIARRTVAKYREALNIPSSVQRRRLKKLSA